MKKILNNPSRFVDDMLQGILKAYSFHLRLVESGKRALARADAPVRGKVGIVTGGGSGHLPVFLGYVGKGLVDAVAVGDVFNSPTLDEILTATKAVNAGEGILYLYGNYSGDVLNFDMSAEMAEMEGIDVETVLVSDDVASAPKDQWKKRRGIAGLFFAYKIAGAKAEERAGLAEVKTAAEKAVFNTRSIGMALSPCTIPAVGKPTFSIGEDEMELGMGIHGEPGIERTKMKTANEIASVMTNRLLEDLPFKKGVEVAVLVNGLGATPLEELFIVYSKVHDILAEKKINVYKSYLGEYATSMEMAGASLSFLCLDEELKRLLNAPAFSPFLPQWG